MGGLTTDLDLLVDANVAVHTSGRLQKLHGQNACGRAFKRASLIVVPSGGIDLHLAKGATLRFELTYVSPIYTRSYGTLPGEGELAIFLLQSF